MQRLTPMSGRKNKLERSCLHSIHRDKDLDEKS